MPFFYQSGEVVEKGDRVLLNGNPGEIECVADAAENPEDRLIPQFGEGVMILEPKVFGRLFLSAMDITDGDEDLQFVSRAQE